MNDNLQDEAGELLEWQRLRATIRGVPRFPVNLPRHRVVLDQIQQIKVTAQPVQVGNQAGDQNQVSSRVMPKHVTGISIVKTPIDNNNIRVSVKFQRDTSDPHFQKANVYLKTSNGTNLVTSGKDSPITFVTSASGAPSSVVVQTEGNAGANPIERSPGRAINLQQTGAGGPGKANTGPSVGSGGGTAGSISAIGTPTFPNPPTFPTNPGANPISFDQVYPGSNSQGLLLVSSGSELAPDPSDPGIVEANYLQNYAVSDATPDDGDVLTFNQSLETWEPDAPSGGIYLGWFHYI